jgi:hypothetical protein
MTATPSQYEPCEECGAPLDPQQRYCVNCAARRGNGANPASRYFAAMSQRARRPAVRPPAKANPGSRAAAVAFFALLPIAVTIGVVVGRGGNDGSENEALLEALHRQESAVASAPAATPTAVSNAGGKTKGKKAEKSSEGGGKVVAKTSNGSVHQVAGYKPPEEKVEEDTRLVEANPEQKGENYIKAQQNLPDVIVVGGDPGSSPAPPTGKGQP